MFGLHWWAEDESVGSSCPRLDGRLILSYGLSHWPGAVMWTYLANYRTSRDAGTVFQPAMRVPLIASHCVDVFEAEVEASSPDYSSAVGYDQLVRERVCLFPSHDEVSSAFLTKTKNC